MTRQKTQDNAPQARVREGDFLGAGLQLQDQALDLLLAEMRALASLMPGHGVHLPDDAEIEAGFDNMPI